MQAYYMKKKRNKANGFMWVLFINLSGYFLKQLVLTILC